MPEALIDAHVHVFTPDNGLSYGWLHEEPSPMGEIERLRGVDWDPARLEGEMVDFEVESLVHVQAADGPDPCAETRWLAGLAGRWPRLAAIVGAADLTSARVEAQLDDHLAASPLFRGVRDLSFRPPLRAEAVEPGLRALVARGLIWELQCVWEEMETALECARRHEELPIIVVHGATPDPADEDGFAEWRRRITALASAPNVLCKLSGFGLRDHFWPRSGTPRWLGHALEAFGAERCLYGSNFPVDSIYSTYAQTVEAVAAATAAAGLTAAEREAVFAATARRLYRLPRASAVSGARLG